MKEPPVLTEINKLSEFKIFCFTIIIAKMYEKEERKESRLSKIYLQYIIILELNVEPLHSILQRQRTSKSKTLLNVNIKEY